MENASKALIIAGSIIISLVIVSLGILVYRRVSGTVTNANLDQQQIEAHNSDYEAYFGDYVSAANTKSLLAKIKTNNTLFVANSESTDEMVPVYVNFVPKGTGTTATITGTMTTVTKEIKSSKHYKIEVNDENISKETPKIKNDGTLDVPGDTNGYYQNGYIKTIKISEV